MPYIKGTAKDYADLVNQVAAWATNPAIHGADTWELVQNKPNPQGTILKGHGWRDGEHFYVGMMPHDFIVGSTYRNWLMSHDTLTRYFVDWSTEYKVSGNMVSWGDKENPLFYNFIEPEIFLKSAKVLNFCTFKQFSDGLDFYEQPGAYVPQKPGLMPLLATASARQWNGIGTLDKPLMPGVGYPAFGMDYSGAKVEKLDFWAIKNRHRLIVVCKNFDIWEVAYLGFLEPYHAKFEYAWPAAVVGATTGATMHGKSVNLYNGIDPSAVTGVMFDYTTVNWSVGRGLPTMAGKMQGSELASVVLTLPDGRHGTFANLTQGLDVVPEYAGGTRVVDWYFPLAYPEYSKYNANVIRPTNTDVASTTHIYGQPDGVTKYQLEPLELVQSMSEDRTDFFGKLPGMSWPSATVDKVGEIEIDGKLHLSVPNGWQDRDFWLHHGLDKIWKPDELLAMQKKIKRANRQTSCIIRLED